MSSIWLSEIDEDIETWLYCELRDGLFGRHLSPDTLCAYCRIRYLRHPCREHTCWCINSLYQLFDVVGSERKGRVLNKTVLTLTCSFSEKLLTPTMAFRAKALNQTELFDTPSCPLSITLVSVVQPCTMFDLLLFLLKTDLLGGGFICHGVVLFGVTNKNTSEVEVLDYR